MAERSPVAQKDLQGVIDLDSDPENENAAASASKFN